MEMRYSKSVLIATGVAAGLGLSLATPALAKHVAPKVGRWTGGMNTGPKCITPQGRKPCQVQFGVQPRSHDRVVSYLQVVLLTRCSDDSTGGTSFYGFGASDKYPIGSDGSFHGEGKNAPSLRISIKGTFTSATQAHGTLEASWDENHGGKTVSCYTGTRKWKAHYERLKPVPAEL
jgi:hypothetical protein